MNTDQIKISIKDFRAIKEAEIALNGITVVAGENGCGKSTISKLLYYIVQSMSNYEQVIIDLQLKTYMRNICSSLLNLIDHPFFDREKRFQAPKITEELFHPTKINSAKAGLLKFILSVKDILANIKQPEEEDIAGYEYLKKLQERTKSILINLLKQEELSDLDSHVDNKSIEELFQMVYKNAQKRIMELEEMNNSKYCLLLDRYLHNIFGQMIIDVCVKIYEYGMNVFDEDSYKFTPLDYINNAIYVDTPMAIGVKSSDHPYWNDLNKLLVKKNHQNSFLTHAHSFLENDILNGNIEIEDNFNVFTYRRKDGTEFNLLECATGIKSFAILQLLLNNGHLTNKTLLILDEPEAHLHPQWIVEYARLLVLLNKEIGVKFFIASHSPDMVSALKYISEKEKTDKNLNFYIAKKEENTSQYRYKHLGTEIGEIFDSYNISYEKLDKYGSTE